MVEDKELERLREARRRLEEFKKKFPEEYKRIITEIWRKRD